VKVGSRWTIRSTSYRRIYEISRQLDEVPQFSARYLAEHGSEVPTGG
jgi:hypothetical protein